MARYSRKYTPTTRKVAAARQAVNRAAKVLGRRSSPYLGLPRTGGFPGNYAQFKSFGSGGRELKFIDVTNTFVNIPAAGAVTLINGVVQGTDFNNRIGRKIVMKSLLSNITLYPSTTAPASTGDFTRLMVIYDTQTNSAATPAVTDILVSADVNSPMNLNNRDRFHVVMDKKYTFYPTAYTAGAITAGNPVTRWCSKYKKHSKDVIFSGTAATIGSIQTGSLLFLYLSKLGDINMDFYFRTRFHDS